MVHLHRASQKQLQLSGLHTSSLLLHHYAFASSAMSDTEPQAAASGVKRSRDEVETNGNGVESVSVPDMPAADLDDSDDEIGPMPDAPSVEMTKGRKKKRAVLPHERVFLDNMPDTDRYTKSFMHRADINFVTMTK